MESYKKIELKDLKRKFRTLEQTRFTLKEKGIINTSLLKGFFFPNSKSMTSRF